ncbi:unnamed protein product [Sympodiomycopsis kandeliae]
MAGFDPIREAAASASSSSYHRPASPDQESQSRRSSFQQQQEQQHQHYHAAEGDVTSKHRGSYDARYDQEAGAQEEEAYRRPSRSASIVALLNPSEERDEQRPSSSASQQHRYDARTSATPTQHVVSSPITYHHHPQHQPDDSLYATSHGYSSPHRIRHDSYPSGYRSTSRPVSQYEHQHQHQQSHGYAASPTQAYAIADILHPTSGVERAASTRSGSRPGSSHDNMYPSSMSSHYQHPPLHSPRYIESADRSSAQLPDDTERDHPHPYYDPIHRRASLRMESRSVSQGSHPGSTGGGGRDSDSPRSQYPSAGFAGSPNEAARGISPHVAGSDSPRSRMMATIGASSPHFSRPVPGGFRVPEIPAHRSPEFRRAPLPPLRTSHSGSSLAMSPTSVASGSSATPGEYAHPAYYQQQHHPLYARGERAHAPVFSPTSSAGSPTGVYNGHPYPSSHQGIEYFRPAPTHSASDPTAGRESMPDTPVGMAGRSSISSITHPTQYAGAHPYETYAQQESQRRHTSAHGHSPTEVYRASFSGPVPERGLRSYSPNTPLRAPQVLQDQSRHSEISDSVVAPSQSMAPAPEDRSISDVTKRRRKSSGGTRRGSAASTSADGDGTSSRRGSLATSNSGTTQEEVQAANAAVNALMSVGRRGTLPASFSNESIKSDAANSLSPPAKKAAVTSAQTPKRHSIADSAQGKDVDEPMIDVVPEPAPQTNGGSNGAKVKTEQGKDEAGHPEAAVSEGLQKEETITAKQMPGKEAKVEKTEQALPESAPQTQSPLNGSNSYDETGKTDASPEAQSPALKRKRSPSTSSTSAGKKESPTPAPTAGKVRTLDLDEVDRLAQRDSKKKKSASSLQDSITSGKKLPSSLPMKPQSDVEMKDSSSNSPSSQKRDDRKEDVNVLPYRPQRVSAPESSRYALSREDLIGLHNAILRRGANRLRAAWADNELREGREPRDGFEEEILAKWGSSGSAGETGSEQNQSDSGATSRSADHENEVARHYNNRQEVGLQQRNYSPILPLKNFNNWAKSVLIGQFGRRGTKVMDMGGGKGGDLQKWDKLGIRELVLADIAATSVEQAEKRYHERKFRFQASFYALDCFGQTLGEVLPASILSPSFDMVSLQFCMHYGWSTLQKARLVIENVSRYLAPGGMFIGTIPDSDELYKRRDALPEDEFEFGNDMYHVRFDQKEKRKPFGDRYTFFLDDAVEDVPEYVVDWDQFESLASEYGLSLVYKGSMSKVWHDHRSKPQYEVLARRMKVCPDPRNTPQPMDDDLWAATTLYCAFAFEKR